MLATCLFAVAAALGSGDVLLLKDGRVVEGVPMARKDEGIELTYQNGTVFVGPELIQDAVLAADSERAPADAAEAEQRKNGMVTFEGR